MAFIPIDAKADLQGQKKGKITPAQHAQLNAWCLASKTGIFECLEKCIANPENITAIQDKTTEITFRKGYLVICGRLVECEDNTKFTFRCPNTGTETGKIVARFSLGSNGEEEFKIIQKTTALVQQDLNENVLSGEYELELYTYEATPTTLKLTRTQEYIPDIGGKLQQFITFLTGTGLSDGEGTPPLQGYDKTKGTIEERLTTLGFKEATITNVNSTYIQNITAFTQGKVVAVKVEVKDFLKTTLTGGGKELVVGNIADINLSGIPTNGLQICSKDGGRDSTGRLNYFNIYTLYNNGDIKLKAGATQAVYPNKTSGGFVHIQGPHEELFGTL